MKTYRFNDPNAQPTVKVRLRWHSISGRWFFNEYDANWRITRQGQVDDEDVPVMLRYQCLAVAESNRPYVDWPQ